MWYENLFKDMEQSGNSEQAEKMSAYMKNKFAFLGIQKPKLKEIEKLYLKESKKYDFDWKFVTDCWDKEYREAQYVAIDYLAVNEKRLTVWQASDFE